MATPESRTNMLLLPARQPEIDVTAGSSVRAIASAKTIRTALLHDSRGVSRLYAPSLLFSHRLPVPNAILLLRLDFLSALALKVSPRP